ETDIDGDWHTDYYGDSGWNSYSYPVRYGYYGTPSNYNPTAGYEAHRKAVEKRKVALKKEREDRLIVK
ncbi:MAG TPA: hypothetical protein HPP91_12950, partial [Gammaproteobacteria bacterium]|nr:hypothetical protein [Gammaproteobacteria bacterium]